VSIGCFGRGGLRGGSFEPFLTETVYSVLCGFLQCLDSGFEFLDVLFEFGVVWHDGREIQNVSVDGERKVEG
jgi:hypothetical protein